MPSGASAPPLPGRCDAVLDTNVLLDWLLFEDASVARLAAAIQAGTLRWLATPAMLAELDDVLQRAVFDRWASRRVDAEQLSRRFCVVVAEPAIAPATRLWCSDPDDQKFIDLALAWPTRWLLSRDKALLRLAKKARACAGVEVLQPRQWGGAG